MATAPAKLKSRPKLWRHAKATPTPMGTERIRGGKRAAIVNRIMGGEPLCRPCAEQGYVTPAQQVDHITPLWKGGAEHDDNRQPICTACHKAKSRIEAGERAVVARGRP